MKNKRTRIFFLRQSSRSGVMPPFLTMYEQPCEQNIWRTAKTRILIFGISLQTKILMNWITFEPIPYIFCWVIPLFRTYAFCIGTTLWAKFLSRFGQDPDIWHVVTDQGVDELIDFWTYSVNCLLSYSPFSDTGILYRNNRVNKISGEPLWLGSWYLAYSYRSRCRWTD